MAYKVFLSHSTKDMELVEAIHKELSNANIETYVAEKEPTYGKSLPETILSKVRHSDCMVVLLTDVAIRSQWVNQEIGSAKMINKLVIPIVEKTIENEVKGLLQGIEYILMDKANPKEATSQLASYLTRLELSHKLKETMITVSIVIAIVMIAVVVYFAFTRR